ncbi:hypothetical protein [Thermoanaerobaculum aquaticum]|uniref:hypothetical protein n=1 Tax=Thermoanaerobaculum aquaticum TaxID=1312852 RepID=UPI001268467D|nr:hypothetical protein [Thermoanaerobaculum aquaticum]
MGMPPTFKQRLPGKRQVVHQRVVKKGLRQSQRDQQEARNRCRKKIPPLPTVFTPTSKSQQKETQKRKNPWTIEITQAQKQEKKTNRSRAKHEIERKLKAGK